MITFRRYALVFTVPAALCVLLLSACGDVPSSDVSLNDRGEMDLAAAVEAGGKADIGKRAKVLDDIALDSFIEGRFDDRTRVYAYTFEAKAGAVVNVAFTAAAGEGASSLRPGEDLDTVIALYGPMDGRTAGERIFYVDDEGASLQGQLPAFEVALDGRYMVALSTWDDPGAGEYLIEVACEGTDFQCRRPPPKADCRAETLYIQGRTQLRTDTWDQCEVVVLESVTLPQGEILSIRPGTTVKANYIGDDGYGEVQLRVDGLLQAIGTEAHPVVFTALKDGWNGLVLRGDSHTLEHVYVEKAKTAIQIDGHHSTLSDLNINTVQDGLRFNPSSTGTVVQRATITGVTGVGIRLQPGASADLADVVLQGAEPRGTRGVHATDAQTSTLRRAVVSGFDEAMLLHASLFEVEDTTIAFNGNGVTVTGDDTGLTPAYTCPQAPRGIPAQSRPRPAPPATWGVDPIFTRCDFVKNEGFAMRIDAPELVQISGSNIVGNHSGVIIEANSVHPDSRITGNNIYGNGEEAQVVAGFINGTLDISGNYWMHISDPELSASWQTNFVQRETCSAEVYSSSNPQGHGWSCRSTSYRNYACSMSLDVRFSSTVDFTHFSPVELTAGPWEPDLTDAVAGAREALGL